MGVWGSDARGVETGEWRVGGGVWKKCEKLLKKKKKGRQIFRPAAPRKLISPYALGGGGAQNS
jgi:hypothetical protein